MRKHHPRQAQAPRLTRLAALMATSSLAGLLALPAEAQTAAPAAAPAAPAADVGGLERVVVTATSTLKSKMRSSVSVTDIDQEQVRDLGVRSEAEVLLLIPGIRTEPTAGPGGNSNISVRGLPISSGGSKYVQLQEDGLPTVQFGDMNFGNNDYWTRFDNNVDRIQTLRGGSSSVFASQAPGAVINYISKTGKEKGGSLGLSRGLNYNETRVDGDYGDKIGNDTYFHLGGYYREGEGARHSTANSLLGYQLKGNLTKEFNGGKGYVRAYFKVLDEHAPTTPQTFVNATKSGSTIGGFSTTAGYDGTRDSQYSIYNQTAPGIDPVTRERTNNSLVKGITVKSNSVGAEFHNELASGWTVDDKFRITKASGAFQAQFWDVQTLASHLSNFAGAASFRYYNGPNAGQTVTAANLQTGLVSKGAAINVQLPDMGNMVNDLSLGKNFKLGDGTSMDVKGGLFHSRQNVVQRWMISERLVEVGKNGAVLDAYNSAGAALTTAGLTGYNNQWGGCCARDVDMAFTTTAPYLSLNVAAGPVDIDAGIRREQFKANGTYAGGTARAYDVDGNGTITGAENSVYLIDPGVARGLANYSVSYTNYSLGANYRLTSNLSGFVRTSSGHRAVADRLLFSANVDAASGLLTAGGASAAVAPVKQHEIGVKNRGAFGDTSYSVSATYFRSTTTEFDYDQTRQDNPNLPNYAGPKLNVFGFKASGVEVESTLGWGDLSLNVNVVYSNEKKTQDFVTANIGKTSGGVPKLRYTISPRYSIGPVSLGATIRGQGSVYASDSNTDKIGGHFVVNSFVNYEFAKGLVASLNINNLFDKVYPTGGGGFVGGSTTVFGAGLETGRTIGASVRYNF